MRLKLIAAVALATFAAPAALAQRAPAASSPVTVEHYYRIKWGSAGEFMALYRKNHAPILEEMRRQGFITSIRTEEPLTHMAGGQRWDLRVTIAYRDGDAAVVAGGAYDKAAEAATARLYPARTEHRAVEARRFGLLEEHWDVVVVPASE
jgi:hypothetical protein